MQRFWEIDFLRGIAIVMMVVFHFLWDLNYFGYIQVDLYKGFFGLFQIATAGLFLLLVGVMLAVGAERHNKNYSLHFVKRGIKIFCAGLLVTIVTFIFFPQNFVYFGILHLIGVSIIISIPLAKKKLIPLVLAILVLVLPLINNLQLIGINALVWVGLAQPLNTLDFTPLFPWFSAVLFGIGLGNYFYPKGKRLIELKEPKNSLNTKLQFLGKHSLLIYLIHQPIIFGLIWLTTLL